MQSQLNDTINLVLSNAKDLIQKLSEAQNLLRAEAPARKWLGDAISMVMEYSNGLRNAAMNKDGRRVSGYACLLAGNERYFTDGPAYPHEDEVMALVEQVHASSYLLGYKLINDLSPASLEQANEALQSFTPSDAGPD